MLKRSVLKVGLLTVMVMVSLTRGAASAEVPLSPLTTPRGPAVGGQVVPPGTKTFSKQTLQKLLKDLFMKQRAELWGKMMDQSGKQEENGKRIFRREAEKEGSKKVLTFEQEDNLAAFIGELMACQNIPGLTLALVRGGVRQGLGYGVGNMETARPVDEDTLFGIGSNTKAFAAATVAYVMSNASLPADKKFSFGTPLQKLIKDLRLPDNTSTSETTVLDVLSHRTGMGSGDLGIFTGYHHNVTAGDVCRRLQFLPKMFQFRTAWYYSNTMFAIISRLCQLTAGKSWADVASESIFQPLQMNNTFMTPEAMSRDNVALPYVLRMSADDMFVEQDHRLFDIHPLETAGAIMSSSKDMTSWLSYLLDVIKRPATSLMYLHRQMFQDRIPVPIGFRQQGLAMKPVPILHVGYGMGFFTSYYKGEALYWHTGDYHGYKSHLLVVPGWESAVYVAINGVGVKAASGTILFNAAYFILELMQGGNPWVNLTLACPEGWEAAKTTPRPDAADYDYTADDTQATNREAQTFLRPIEDYTGVYGHGLLGDLVIAEDEEGSSLLRLELGRLLVADLLPTKNELVLKLAARAPVADTAEFEKQFTLVFKSAPAPPLPTSAPVPAAASPSSSSSSSPPPSSKNATFSEKEPETTVAPKSPLVEVSLLWELELYTFRKSVRFDTALVVQGGGGAGGTEPGCTTGQTTEGVAGRTEGSGEKPKEDNIPNAVAPSVGDSGASQAASASALKVVIMLVYLAIIV